MAAGNAGRLCLYGAAVSLLAMISVASPGGWGGAAAPDDKELNAAIRSGDLGNCLVGLSTWLSQKVPADTNRISEDFLKDLRKDPVVNAACVRRQFTSKCGVANPDVLAKTAAAGREFLSWLLHDTKAMEMYLEASTPTGLRAREKDNWTPRPGSLDTWKQIHFPQQMNSCVAEYEIHATESGKYEITMTAAAINDGQILQVGSDAFNAVAYVRIPVSHGLWKTTAPVDVKVVEGLQKIQISTFPGQRGVALRSFELRPKER